MLVKYNILLKTPVGKIGIYISSLIFLNIVIIIDIHFNLLHLNLNLIIYLINFI